MTTPSGFDDDNFPLPAVSEVVMVTPETARAWLKRNKNNRAASPYRITQYVDSMSAGAWLLTHQGIAFSAEDGTLIDGQNRLQAVVRSGVAVPFWVHPRQDPDTFAVVDTGLARQAGQFIDHPQRYAISAAARLVGTITGRFDGPRIHGGVWDLGVPAAELLVFVGDWRDRFYFAASIATPVYRQTHISLSSHIAMLAMVIDSEHADRIEEWGRGLETGIDLSAGDARLLLRTRFIRDYARLNAGGNRRESLSLVFKAWNAYVRRDRLGVLRQGAADALPWPAGCRRPKGSRS